MDAGGDGVMPGTSLRDYQAYVQLERQVSRLEQDQQRRAGSVEQDGYGFTVHPTCPPSTSVIFRGGYAWRVYGYLIEWGYYTPSYTVDLTDEIKVLIYGAPSPWTYTFTNPYWYMPALFIVRRFGTPPTTWPDEIPNYLIFLYCRIDGVDGVEYETAAEAEAGYQQIIGDLAADSGVVCGGIIIRNNGDIINPNQYQPVDKVNRGRSYLFGAKRYGWALG